MIKDISRLKPGQVAFDVHSHLMGNTTQRSIGVWRVKIVAIDPSRQIVRASWNGNEVENFYFSRWSKWRLKEPLLIKSGWAYRLATRAEIKASKTPA